MSNEGQVFYTISLVVDGEEREVFGPYLSYKQGVEAEEFLPLIIGPHLEEEGVSEFALDWDKYRVVDGLEQTYTRYGSEEEEGFAE